MLVVRDLRGDGPRRRRGELINAPGSLGWVELLCREPERAMEFYTAVFGWSVNASERYTQWGLDDADFGGTVTMDDKFPPEVPPRWLPYFAVEDVDTTAAATATEAGGTVLMEPTSGLSGTACPGARSTS